MTVRRIFRWRDSSHELKVVDHAFDVTLRGQPIWVGALINLYAHAGIDVVRLFCVFLLQRGVFF